MNRLILASASPRRREILSLAGFSFDVFPTDVDESLPEGLTPEEAVRTLACRKVAAARQKCPEGILVGADTLVFLDGQPFGKPSSQADAARMLAALSGRVHQVSTGVCVLWPNGARKSFCETANVEFYPLSREEIQDYLATGEPMGKAGSYAVQGRGCVLVKRIEGDFYTVVGLPIARLARVLRAGPPPPTIR